jgi:hypothetical protein
VILRLLEVLACPGASDPGWIDEGRMPAGADRADHLDYTLWVNRSQPVNAYAMKAPRNDDGSVRIEKILPNVTPTIRLER